MSASSATVSRRAPRRSRAPQRSRRGRRGRRGGRQLRLLAWALIVAGTLMLADVVLTVLWQEPITALVALVARADENRGLLTLRLRDLSTRQQQTLRELTSSSQRLAFLAERENSMAANGAALGVISIPAIGVHYTFVQGTGSSSLRLGPGHYPVTELPGMGGTIAIAGHRTTYLAPFRRLAELRVGEPIILRMPYGTFTYVVRSLRVVSPSAWWIARLTGSEQLVLSACTPLFSAAQRLVVFAPLRSATEAPAVSAFTGSTGT